MHAVRETDTLGESVAAVSADAATTIAPVSASESTSAMLVNEDTATAIADAASTRGKTGEFPCQGTLQNSPATHKNREMGPLPGSNSNMQKETEADPPRINTFTPESAELLTSIANLDNVFLGPPSTLWPEDELQDIEETEVMPIELEDDDFNVICPTCYDFLPGLNGLECHTGYDTPK